MLFAYCSCLDVTICVECIFPLIKVIFYMFLNIKMCRNATNYTFFGGKICVSDKKALLLHALSIGGHLACEKVNII